MEASKAIQHKIGGVQNEALRFGLRDVKSDLVRSHPLQSAYESKISYKSCGPLLAKEGQQHSLGCWQKLEQFTHGMEDGWKLATNGRILYGSDGTSTLYEIDPQTLKGPPYKMQLLYEMDSSSKFKLHTFPEAWYLPFSCRGSFKVSLRCVALLGFQRPLLASSMLGLEALTGTLDDFGFEDYLNDPRESETVRSVDLHHSMEVRLGLSFPHFSTIKTLKLLKKHVN
ncbi:hypothetical protein GQ457_07G009870 [Hibiscus cannabinus]